MKFILTTLCLSLSLQASFAQINIDAKKIKKIKEAVGTVSDNNNTQPEVQPKKATEDNTPNKSAQSNSSSSSSTNELQGWTPEEINKIGWTNAFLGSGWTVDQIQAKAQYNDELKVQVVEIKYYSSCYSQPLMLHVFKMNDKGAVGAYDFNGNASKNHPQGRYKSEVIIVDKDKYIMVFSFFSKLDTQLDAYADEKFPELQRRLPNEWR